MVRGREQSTGRAIRTGWTETEDSLTAPPTFPPPLVTESPCPQGPRRLAAMLTALALLAVAMPWLLLRGEGPEDVARAYLDALIDGDLAVVREHLAPLEGVEGTALTAPVRAATPGGITGYTVEEVVVRGVIATVRVTLRNPREEHTSELTLIGVPDGPLRRLHWELEPVPLPVLALGPRADAGAVLLNGYPVEIPAVHWEGRRTDRPSVALHVLPGRYTVELPPTAAPLEPRTTEVYVPPVLGHWQTGLLSVEYRPDRDAEASARSVILDELDQCLRSGVARPSGCPIGVPLPADAPGSWQLLELPEISCVEMVGETFDYRGQGLIAQFLPAESHAGNGELTDPGSRARRISIDFGVTLRRDGPDLELQHWTYSTVYSGRR